MIITGAHWFIAIVIAVAVHLVGMLWLSITEPAESPRVDSARDGIVVTLGGGRRNTVEESPQAPEAAPQSTDTTLEAAQPEPPETGTPEPAEAEPAYRSPTQVIQPDESTTPEAMAAESVTPDPAVSRPLRETRDIEPELTEAAEMSQPPAAVPETTASPQIVDVTAADTPSVAVEAVPGAAPDVPEAAVEEASPGPGTPAEPVTARAATTVAMDATVEPGEAAPAEFADDAPLPRPSEAPAPVAEAGTSASAPKPAAEAPGAGIAPSAPAAGSAAPVMDVETAPADRRDTAMEVRGVEPDTGDAARVDVAAARPAAPDTQETFEPRVVETTAPETVDLQELQERSGGTGVVAHYAGVLKGWLQRNMHYPRAARVAGQEGDVVVRFIIDRQGNVQSVELESGSGYPLLDREATEMVERGNPFPEMPEDMPGERLEVRVPVSFHVREETRTRNLPPIDLE